MNSRMSARILLLALFAQVDVGEARAAEPSVAPLPGPTAVEALRLDFLQTRFDAASTPAQLWWWGWVGGYSALTIGQGAVGLRSHDEGLRINMWVGAASSLIGLAGVLLSPPPMAKAGRELRGVASLGPQERLAAGERLLRDSADTEQLGRSPLMHGIGLAVAAAQGLVLWLGYKRPSDGAVGFAVSVAISELQIWTQPTSSVDALAEYRINWPASSARSLAVAPQ